MGRHSHKAARSSLILPRLGVLRRPLAAIILEKINKQRGWFAIASNWRTSAFTQAVAKLFT
jgi:hypothetical protein